jgi:hypothetical protein
MRRPLGRIAESTVGGIRPWMTTTPELTPDVCNPCHRAD